MRPRFRTSEPRTARFSEPRKIAAAVALALAAACGAPAAEPAAAPDGPALWFPVGEELVYRIHWGVIPVGESRATTAWVEEDGRRLLAIRFRTLSNKFLSKIYPVDDTIESLVDPDGFRPVRFTKKLSEGSHRYDQVTTFDRAKGEAHWVSQLDGRERRFPVKEDTRDIPTLMYFLRAGGLATNETRNFEVMADEKVYALETRTFGIESVALPRYGRVPSLKIEPRAAFGGVFVRKGRMWMWVAQEPRRLATLIAVEVPVAKVRLTLHEVRGPGGDFWVDPKAARPWAAAAAPEAKPHGGAGD
jgi:hypothetical protein